MALDPNYVVAVSIEEYFVDHSTGLPLANGTIEFWKDNNRLDPKTVYQLTGAPPNYTYTALPNPLNLSSVGTPINNSGDPISIYYYPYDANGNVELYYLVVKDSSGTVQLTRQAQPNTTASGSGTEQNPNITNELSNPQFVDINFPYNNPLTINVTGSSTTTVAIAPKWDLVITHTGAGTVVVQRNAIAGTSAYPYNPPYTLTITPGLNISSLQLRQRLLNNPNVFAPAAGGTNGYLSGSILLAPGSAITMKYQPNGQATQTILTANNASGAYTQYNETVQLTAANNTNDGDNGYVDILINLSVSAATTLSNVQIIGLDSDVLDVNYDQNTADRQRDQLFNYYNPLLSAKPIPSYLVGWDFPLNPAQLGATIAASAIGANKSKYTWDQTIVFQSANSGVGVTRSASGNGALRLTAANTTQSAIVQYLPQAVARRVLQGDLSVNVSALTAKAGGLVGTVSLWYTTDVSLPSVVGSNNSLIATLDANGKPATFNGTWTEVTRNGLGDASFTVTNADGLLFNDYGFSGWSLNGAAAVDTATYMAIVVGFASLTAAETIDIGSVSLVPGSIPTRPAPQARDEVLRECQYYYGKSFFTNVAPANALGASATGVVGFITSGVTYGGGPVYFPVTMYATPSVQFYNPVNNNAQFYSPTAAADCSNSSASYIGDKGFLAQFDAPNAGGNTNIVAYTADARLGQ